MAIAVTYSVVNDWGSGKQASITLSPTGQALTGWTLEFHAPFTITQIWNARIISQVGNHYVIGNADWNGSVAGGASVSFGFLAGPGGAPTSYVVNGTAIGGTAPPPPPDLPAATIADVTLAEGDGGTTEAVFTVTLSKAASAPVTFAWTTQDGTARAGSDYTAGAGTLSFAAGETSRTIRVAVQGDTLVEGDESFGLALSAPAGATLARASATATIRNDDVLPAIGIADIVLDEGNSGTRNAVFTLSLSKAAASPVTVNWTTQDGTARAGSDYTAASGTVTFAAGETSRTVSVAVLGDTAVETDETFSLALSAAAGATIGRGSATATLRNDDTPPPSAGATVTYSVPNSWGSGFIGSMTVLAGGTALNGWTVEFDAPFQITNIWGGEIVSKLGSHYVVRNAAWNGSLAGGTSTSFGFQAATTAGSDVSLLTLNGAGATPTPPSLSVAAGAAVTEGSGTGALASFTLSLSKAAATAVTVNYATADGTAKAGTDYAAASGTVTFAAGETTKTVTIGIIGDAIQEPNESFGLVLSAASGATLGTASATATILDDDAPAPPPPATHPGFWHTAGNQIVDDAGAPVKIAGVNWFGLETANFAPHGLWARNWSEMMDQMKSLGFNAIRLPFSGELFDPGRTPNGIDFGKNPDLVGLNGLQIMDKVVAHAGEIGLRIILDHHRSAAGGGPNGNGLWFEGGNGEADWLADWSMLAAHYAGNPTVVGADLANEPHAASWGDGGATDWRAAATRAGNAIHAVNPDWLIFVEGTGASYWWGGDLTGVRTAPVVLNTPNKVVYSPHDYPNSVYPQSFFYDPAFPNNMTALFDQKWGYIYREGIAPVMLGEFGSKLTDPKDVAWLQKLTAYLGGDFDADGTKDIPAGQEGISWTWWSWNPNSGDTGGILADDWITVKQPQIDALRPIMADASPIG